MNKEVCDILEKFSKESSVRFELDEKSSIIFFRNVSAFNKDLVGTLILLKNILNHFGLRYSISGGFKVKVH